MILNTRWLFDYLSPRPALEDLLRALPQASLEVEGAFLLKEELAPIRIGFIRGKEPLAESPGKFVCDVELQHGERRTIVCASEHPIEIGWGVPVAPAGIDLPTGIPIKEERFHGVLSQGMICLDGEMGMVATGTGLHVFKDEAVLGRPLVDVIDVSEALLDLKIPPNRPDCLGLIGIAREIAALLDLNLVLPEAALSPVTISDAVAVEIDDPDLCPRYTCQVVKGVRVAKSSPWLHSRLLAIGSRPINNVVDITNFVLNEWGQPLHAFDLAHVREKIVVRRFRAGETLELLDGRTVDSKHEPLAIADAQVPLALAGIMGGAPSAIGPATVDVLLEAAYFEPARIRRTSRTLGVSTDSSYRFERGMDPNETLQAAQRRAISLLLSEAKGQGLGEITDAYLSKKSPRVFSLSAGRASSYLGVPVSQEQVHTSLGKLGYRFLNGLEEIEVPTRRVDANDPVVLIEDLARIIGYEVIQGAPSAELPTAGSGTPLERSREIARKVLTEAGFLETRGVPLEPANRGSEFVQISGDPIAVINPLNEDLSRLRRSLVPSLLNVVFQNARRHSIRHRHFEIDKDFHRPAEAPEEVWAIGMLLAGPANDADWSTRRNADFYDLKGIVESLFDELRCPAPTFLSEELAGFAAGTSARILLHDSAVGIIGQVLPDTLAQERIQEPVFAAEILIERLLPAVAGTAIYEPLPRFPAVFRDLSFVIRKDIPYADVEHNIRRAAGSLLESVQCMDVFAGKDIPAGSRSIAVSLVFRASDRTLSSEEVTEAVERIIESLGKAFDAQLRNR
jgi:phenylalanyl-tRNA synthetase beta chain